MDADTVAVLREHRYGHQSQRKACGQGWAAPGHVFTRELSPATVTTRFECLVRGAGGLPPVRLHDLR